MKNKKRMNAISVFGLLCCFAFVVSACGNSETGTTPKADIATNYRSRDRYRVKYRSRDGYGVRYRSGGDQHEA